MSLKELFQKTPTKEYSDRNEALIKAVMQQNNINRKTAVETMEKARKDLGISFYVFYKDHCYGKTPEEQLACKVKRQERQKKKDDKQAAEKEIAIKNIMDYAEVSKDNANAILEQSVRKTRCKYSEYNEFKMYKYPMDVQKQLFLKDMSNKISRKYETNFKLLGIIQHKEKADEYFKEYMRRPSCSNRDLSFEKFCKTFDGVEKIFYKPSVLHGGRGAKLYELNEKNIRQVYDEIVSLQEGVVEKYIEQHHKMRELYSDTVNTIRFATIYSEHGPIASDGRKMDICYVVQKMGGKGTVVDNLHQGGYAAMVDVDSGKISTDAIDMHGNIHQIHPDSGTTIKGFEIPYFEEAKKMVYEMLEKYKMYGYLGWDICIEEDGPSVVEINGRPGVNLPTYTLLVTEHKGIKKQMSKYL